MCKYCASDGGGFQDSLMNWDREQIEYNQAALYRYILLQLSPGLHLLMLYRNSALPPIPSCEITYLHQIASLFSCYSLSPL